MNQFIRFAPLQSQAPKAPARAIMYHKLRVELLRTGLDEGHLEARQRALKLAAEVAANVRDEALQRVDRLLCLRKVSSVELGVGERRERRRRRDDELLDAEGCELLLDPPELVGREVVSHRSAPLRAL